MRNGRPRYVLMMIGLSISTVPIFQRAVLAQSMAVLADAAERQELSRLQKQIASGANVNVPQADGMTALHWAVLHDDESATTMLIEAGAEIDSVSRYGVTPLSLACRNGSGSLVRRLLESGADPGVALPGGETPLMIASRTGRLEPVACLLGHGADPNAKESKGQTALMWAAAEGHLEVVDALLAAGADSHTSLTSGFTPLFFAVREGRMDVAKRLLDAGVDVNDVMSPQKRVRKGPTEGISPLILAVENGHFDLAVMLLEAGADPNDQRSGYTAIHTLTWVRKPKRGDEDDGDPSPVGSGARTSLQLVRELTRFDTDFDARLIRGPAPRARLSKIGATAFLMACETADLPLLQLLVELGADPTIGNSDGCTPLMAAAGIGQDGRGEEAGTEEEALRCVEYLVSLGADVNVVDNNGQTAMHGAAYKSAPSIVRYLASRGADVAIWNRPDRYQRTPLHLAHGHRPGNFKPSPETIEALGEVMRASGVEPATDGFAEPPRVGYEP